MKTFQEIAWSILGGFVLTGLVAIVLLFFLPPDPNAMNELNMNILNKKIKGY